ADSGNDNSQPHRSVYTVFRNAGLLILPAAMSSKNGQSKVARVPKEAGINVVRGLLCDKDDRRRLYVACDDRRRPLAPRLVESLELSEKEPTSGEAEVKRKGKPDLSHWTAALRYALWQLERPRFGQYSEATG